MAQRGTDNIRQVVLILWLIGVFTVDEPAKSTMLEVLVQLVFFLWIVGSWKISNRQKYSHKERQKNRREGKKKKIY